MHSDGFIPSYRQGRAVGPAGKGKLPLHLFHAFLAVFRRILFNSWIALPAFVESAEYRG